MFKIHTNPNIESNFSQEFIDSFISAIKIMLQDEYNALFKLYGNNEEKILSVLKEKFKMIADISN